jgi:hypothetical protein
MPKSQHLLKISCLAAAMFRHTEAQNIFKTQYIIINKHTDQTKKWQHQIDNNYYVQKGLCRYRIAFFSLQRKEAGEK